MQRGLPDVPRWMVLGPLRDPTGINPLTTGLVAGLMAVVISGQHFQVGCVVTE
jgi:hypothetical protein